MLKTNNSQGYETVMEENSPNYVKFKQVFISNLKCIESELLMSKSQIAQICGVSRPTVAQWFVGKCWPRMICVYRLARAINCDVGAFFKEDGIHITKQAKPVNWRTQQNQANFVDEMTEVVGDNFVLGDLSDAEKSIIANYRLLSDKGRDTILHILTLEGRYCHDKQMHDIRKSYPHKRGRPAKK